MLFSELIVGYSALKQAMGILIQRAIHSVSKGSSDIHESGHFYFTQTGHAHFAATDPVILQDPAILLDFV
jgi:hypothetical protein